MSAQQLAEYLEKTAEDVDLALGRELLKKAMGSKPRPDSEYQDIAQRWFELRKDRIATAICKNGGIGHMQKSRNEIAATVLGILAHGLGMELGVPTALLTAKVIHYGIDKLCTKGDR